MPDDELNAAELRDLVDAMAATIPEIARGHKRVYDEFLAVGFRDDQALVLTVTLLHGGRGQPE